MSSSDPRHETGSTGERTADAFFENRGARVVARNWKCKIGELDLVVLEDEILVFVEVKTRTTASHYDGGLEAITRGKRRKIESLARAFLQRTDLSYKAVRFDVIAVSGERVRHIPNAWYASRP